MSILSDWTEIRLALGDHVAQYTGAGELVLSHPNSCDVDRCEIRAASATYSPERKHLTPLVVRLISGVVRPTPAHWSDVVAELLEVELYPWQKKLMDEALSVPGSPRLAPEPAHTSLFGHPLTHPARELLEELHSLDV